MTNDITLIVNGQAYNCTPITEPAAPSAWAFPVGNYEYPPEDWYIATWHDLTGARNNGYKHTGIDINLDESPWGDIERTLGLHVYALADGVVRYTTQNWSGCGMIVIEHEHEGKPLYVRYAHITGDMFPSVGTRWYAGNVLGSFDNWKTGDHLHLDMALDPFSREWLTPSIRWLDPLPILAAHLDSAIVKAMGERG